MKKRTYKQLQNRLLRETKKRLEAQFARIDAERDRKNAEERATYYKRRIQEIGKNMETIDTENGGGVVTLKWEIKPEPIGAYLLTNKFYTEDVSEIVRKLKDTIAKRMADMILENDLVQLFTKEGCDYDPLESAGTIAGKLYVVPWEQMPHKRTLELREMVKNI